MDVLIIEDEENIADLIADILKVKGFKVRIAYNSTQAFSQMQNKVPNAIILDVWLKGSDLDGLGILEKVKARYNLLPVIVISGHGTIDTAISAVKLGAYDYIAKPLSQEKLLLTLRRACEAARLRGENLTLKSRIQKENELMGSCAVMRKLEEEIDKVAQSSGRVFIFGPHGCEQDTVARLVHAKSNRSSRPMVQVNPYIMTVEKIENAILGQSGKADVFGKKIGFLEAAQGSTIYFKDVDLLQ